MTPKKKALPAAALAAAVLLCACTDGGGTSSVNFNKDEYIKRMQREDPSALESYMEAAEQHKQAASELAEVPPLPRGSITDANGLTVISTKTAPSGALYRDIDERWSPALSNIFTDTSGGFDTVWNDLLRNASKGDAGIGQNVKTTIDAAACADIYALAAKELSSGSIVVSEDDGALVCLLSFPCYDENKLGTDGYELPSGSMLNRTLIPAPPGSVFKTATSALAALHGFGEGYTYTDYGTIDVYGDGRPITNDSYDPSAYPVSTDLYDAVLTSKNTFFCFIGGEIGSDTARKEFKKYFALSTGSPIVSDIGELECSLLQGNDAARAFIGQGDVRLTPVYLNTLVRSVITNKLMKPFAVRRTESGGETQPEVLSELPEDMTSITKSAMQGVAERIGLTPPEGCTVYAKTGTAETGGDDMLWLGAYYENAGGESYSVTIQAASNERGYIYGKELAPLMNEIAAYLMGDTDIDTNNDTDTEADDTDTDNSEEGDG